MTKEQLIILRIFIYLLVGIFITGFESYSSKQIRYYLVVLWPPFLVFITCYYICFGTFLLGKFCHSFIHELVDVLKG